MGVMEIYVIMSQKESIVHGYPKENGDEKMQGENRFIKLLLFSTAGGGKFFFTDSVPQQTSLF